MNPFAKQVGKIGRLDDATVGGWVYDRKLPVWLILLLCGGGLMMISFVVPWWRISFKLTDATPEDRARVDRATKKETWYGAYGLDQTTLLNMKKNDDSKMLFGWHTGAGITSFIFSQFIIAWGIVPWFVRVLKPWAWIGFFVCMIMGLVSFILSLVWFVSAPGDDVGSLLSQFVIVGPYLLMPSSLIVFVAGLLGGIFGVLAFRKSFQST